MYSSCQKSPMALQWARDVSGGGADQRRDRCSCPASQDKIANKSPIAMEKQRLRSPSDD
ncbi:hypothetical protein TIFTF001_018019 [Ficus carica]|uniref:Uncharacterized protein n=1 Tax=Ficus carica TaxID=3494 RepID=A0AA88AV42_FICCA|nr:hypothetical protein TIFTF001_018019 [Ficus carica]